MDGDLHSQKPHNGLGVKKRLLSYTKHPGTKTIRSDHDVSIFHVPDRVSGNGNLFIKVYILGTLGQRLKSALRRRRSGYHDLAVNRRLKSIGIPVPEPVGACNDFSFRYSAWHSIFANQWLDDAISLRDYIVMSRDRKKRVQSTSGGSGSITAMTVPLALMDDKWLALDQHALLCRQLGEFVRLLHDKGVSNTDLNAGNIMLCQTGHNGYRFFLVDYERVTFHRSVEKKWRIKNLAQLAASMKGLIPTTVSELAEGYGTSTQINGEAGFIEALHQQADELADRWKQREDDNFKTIYRHLQK